MANTKSAAKNIRKSRKNRKRNLTYKDRIKKMIKAFHTALKKSKDDAAKTMIDLFSAIDKAALKKVIHKNKAARQKSVLQAQFNKSK